MRRSRKLRQAGISSLPRFGGLCAGAHEQPRRRREPRSGTSEACPYKPTPRPCAGAFRAAAAAHSPPGRRARSPLAGARPFRALPPAPPVAGACRSAGACSRCAPVPRCGRLAGGCAAPFAPLRFAPGALAPRPGVRALPRCPPRRPPARSALPLRSGRAACACAPPPSPSPLRGGAGPLGCAGAGPRAARGTALPRRPFSRPRGAWALGGAWSACGPPDLLRQSGMRSSRFALGEMHQTGKWCVTFLTLRAPFPSAEKAAQKGGFPLLDTYSR